MWNNVLGCVSQIMLISVHEQSKGTLRESIEVLRIPAMVHATALRFWQGAADTTSLTFSVYYLTFVDDLTTQEGSRILFVTGALCALEDLWNRGATHFVFHL